MSSSGMVLILGWVLSVAFKELVGERRRLEVARVWVVKCFKVTNFLMVFDCSKLLRPCKTVDWS